jgi:hypothetical protein
MDSVLNLLFEEWNDVGPIPNGNQFGCRHPYCREYVDVNNIRVEEIENYSNVYFPIDLNSDFSCIFRDGFFSQNILRLLYEGKIRVLLLREHEGGGDHKWFFRELDILIKNNNLQHSSFYLYFANKNLLQHYKDSVGDIGLNVEITDWLLEHTSLIINKALEENKITELGYRLEVPSFENIDRKFNYLCLNRVPKAHRVSFLAKMIKDGTIENTDWSLLFSPHKFLPFYGEEKDGDVNIFSTQHFSLYFDERNLESYKKELQYLFYTQKKTIYEPSSKNIFQYFGDTKSTHFKKSYDSSYCSLVTETSFENNEEHLTEKSFKPFLNLHLAIFLAPYKHLERLKGYGFQTFDDLWDESYDDIINPKERMNEVVRLVKSLNKSNRLKHLYNSAREIMEFNQKHVLDFWKKESCKKYFIKLINE